MEFTNDGNELDYADEWAEDATQWDCKSCGFKNCSFMPVCEVCSQPKGHAAPALAEAPATVRALILGDSKLKEHQAAFRADPGGYVAEVHLLLSCGVAISSAVVARVAATLAAEGRHAEVDLLLEKLSVAELLMFLKMLDAPRKVRQLKRRLAMLSARKAKAATKKRCRVDIDALEREVLDGGNVTGSLAKKVRRRMKAFPPEKLEFFLLLFPTAPWKELADLVHFAPGDFSLPYFLACVHGAEPPAGSLVAEVQACNDPNLLPPLLDKHPNLFTMYSFVRRKFMDVAGGLPDAVKVAMAERAPLEDVLWFYEELDAPGVEPAVHARLTLGESLEAGRGRTNYGKLMERLLLFRSRDLSIVPPLMVYAEAKLRAMVADTDAAGRKVAVLGDASGSMEVAINTATILGSLLSVCLDADLRFFNDTVFDPPVAPTSAASVLAVTEVVPATGVTAPAAALWPYLDNKVKCDLFVVVSDEEENTPCHDLTFAKMFAKYRTEVNPEAKCFLVSFLTGPTSFLGKMNAGLRNEGIRCKQFRLDPRRPDLSKLPNLLALLTLELGGSAKAKAAALEAAHAATTANATTIVDPLAAAEPEQGPNKPEPNPNPNSSNQEETKLPDKAPQPAADPNNQAQAQAQDGKLPKAPKAEPATPPVVSDAPTSPPVVEAQPLPPPPPNGDAVPAPGPAPAPAVEAPASTGDGGGGVGFEVAQ